MSDEEDDYMSDKILSSCVSSNEKRPGLINQPSRKREHEQYKKRLEMKHKKPKSTRVLEEESRQVGLETSIPEDNKGFALLQKMGYVPGEGLGKKDKGITEPIKINLKLDRFGLGRESILKEIIEYKTQKMRERLKNASAEFNVEDYRKRLVEKANESNIRHDLFKSQRVCENLDVKKNIDTPGELWFWPEKPKEEESDVSEDEEVEVDYNLEPPEKLLFLTDYLRTCHLYCIWCGTEFEDAEDMSSNCPGNMRDLH